LFVVGTNAQTQLTGHKITLKTGKSFNLNLPANYEITAAAEGLKRPRFFAKAPDGRIFVTDLHDLTDNRKGTVYILDEFDLETGKFRKVTAYLTNLHNPNSAQFYTDENGQDWLYLALTDKLIRYKFQKGETAPSDKSPETLATFPDYGLSYKYGGWHLTRTVAINPETRKIYVSIGSSCNACQEKEKMRASVLEMNPDGSRQRRFATGLRNAVGLKFVGKNLFATNQGADHLGLNKPDETLHALKNGADYGWAKCYQSNGRIFADPEFGKQSDCRKVPAAYARFPAHSSALGFDYFDKDTPDKTIQSAFLVALHGATNEKLGHGYKIVVIRKGEKPQDFITGFLQNGKVNGRPCDVMRLDENSFLFSDDRAGAVYYVKRKQ
jgi:glucose/arabinose dehydrogenase